MMRINLGYVPFSLIRLWKKIKKSILEREKTVRCVVLLVCLFHIFTLINLYERNDYLLCIERNQEKLIDGEKSRDQEKKRSR